MLVQINYLGNHSSVDAGPLLSALCAEVSRRSVDPARLLVTLDWVQYRKNFRPPVAMRRYVSHNGEPLPQIELAVDARRIGQAGHALPTALDEAEGVAAPDHVYLEGVRPPSQSVIWSFNAAYWRNLSTWEAVFNRDFLAALPGGVTDGANPQFWNDRLTQFIEVLDGLRSRGVLPEEIYVLELGVGSGNQARVWLDTFRDLCAAGGRDYYGRVRYLMTDFSNDVLKTARAAVAEHAERVSALNVDVVNLQDALSFLRYKVLFIHSCNLYDNLPSDEIARRNGKLYEVQTRAHLQADAVEDLCARYDLDPSTIVTTIERLLRVGPEYFDDVARGVQFWAEAWDAIRLEERYVLIEQPSQHRIAAGVSGIWLEEFMEGVEGDLRMHVSSDALKSFVNTLPLLHPNGVFQVQDLFTTRLEQFRGAFRGPGKMDGSVVNWLNGPLFQAVGAHLGYDVHLEPFRYREKSNIVVLTTSQRP